MTVDAIARKALGARIRKIRERKGILLKQVEADTGIAQAYLCRFELGRAKSTPTLRTLLKLCMALEVRPREVFSAIDGVAL